jgi:hypothetical protein
VSHLSGRSRTCHQDRARQEDVSPDRMSICKGSVRDSLLRAIARRAGMIVRAVSRFTNSGGRYNTQAVGNLHGSHLPGSTISLHNPFSSHATIGEPRLHVPNCWLPACGTAFFNADKENNLMFLIERRIPTLTPPS